MPWRASSYRKEQKTPPRQQRSCPRSRSTTSAQVSIPDPELTILKPSTVWIPPDPPPTMTTVSSDLTAFALDLALVTTLPTLDLSSFWLAVTTILSFLISADHLKRESRPGASSMSPDLTLKQAPCQGQTTRPSCERVPSSYQYMQTRKLRISLTLEGSSVLNTVSAQPL
jgi:hypothetical protein